MFRKHFRFRRMVLGLAFAAFAVPAAPALGAQGVFADGGPMPVSVAPVTSTTPSYLRYHEAGYPVGAGPQIKAERARALALKADGLRWTAMAQRYQALQAAKSAPVVASTSDDGFSWADAGIGASTVFGAVLLLGAGIALSRRGHRTGLTHA
jgi:hypothetical protein